MLTILSILPVILVLGYMNWVDRFHREPRGLLTKLFVLGCLSVIPIVFIELYLMEMNTFTGNMAAFYDAFVVAGLTEETFKWLIVVVIAYSSKAYDEPLDGIVYAVFVSMGFAVIENILYVYQYGTGVAIMRAVTSVPAHMLFGVMSGFYLSIAKFSNRKIYFILSLVVPIIMHGIYNFILLGNQVFLVLFIPYLMFMFYVGRKRIRKYEEMSYRNDILL